MSKIETLKAYAREQPQLQIVESVRALQQTVGTLPAAVAAETAAALEPLAALRLDVQRVLEAYDQVTAIQRRALDSLTAEMSASAAAAIEQRVAHLDKTLREMSAQVQSLRAATGAAEASAKGMQALPKKLANAATEAANEMQSSAGELARQAQEVRPSAWLTLGQMLGAAVLGALLVAAGQVALNRLVPPSDVQQNADWAASLWAKSSEQERKLLNQIASRPAR